MGLKQFLENNNLSLGEAAKITGLNKSTVSRIVAKDYPNWEAKSDEIITTLKTAGYKTSETKKLKVNPDALVKTASVDAYERLADSLTDPDGSLSSSLGMVIGTAERGKTFTSKWYIGKNPQAVYVLYIDGSTITQLLRDICNVLANTRPHSMSKCITVIEQSCRYNRRLIIIDEADKCPIKHLETLRGINERCKLPFLFVGEEMLKSKIDQVPRLRSRIRNPIVVYNPVDEIGIATYYQTALDTKINFEITKALSKRARGGFRTVANDALALTTMANASGITNITSEMVQRLN